MKAKSFKKWATRTISPKTHSFDLNWGFFKNICPIAFTLDDRDYGVDMSIDEVKYLIRILQDWLEQHTHDRDSSR